MRIDRAYSDIFTPRDADILHGIQAPPEIRPARSRLASAHVVLEQSYYLSQGFVGRTRMDRAGRRQFVALQIPGDYVDLPAFTMKRLDHDLESITEVTLRGTPHERLAALRGAEPELFQKLWHVSLIDAAIHRYWIYRIGRLSGRARIANFFCEMYVRLYARGLGTFDGFALPLTQTDVAEMCGITPVHANRLIAELRSEGACDFSGGRVSVGDPALMFRTGQFSWDYLYLPAAVDADLRQLLGLRPLRAASG